jgi:uncharacterized protein
MQSINIAFLSVLIVAIISQGLKIILNVTKGDKKFRISDLIVTGGMPSTHCALVSCLFAILLFQEGIGSLTTIAFVLFVIVVTDSMGVRRTAGEEALIVNKIIKIEHLKINNTHYALGHKPVEVFFGVCIGFFVAISVWFLSINIA